MYMLHLNGNLMCAVDVETTGLDPNVNEIVQICVLPLNAHCQPDTKVQPFDILIKPENIDGIDKNLKGVFRERIIKAINTGIPAYDAADLLNDWFEKLHLAERKRVSPLGHNWPFDRSFLIKWLGPQNYEYIFDGRYRDTQAVALFLNDRAWMNVEQYPYPKVTLRYISTQLRIDSAKDKFHDAMYDCIITAEIYRRMMQGAL